MLDWVGFLRKGLLPVLLELVFVGPDLGGELFIEWMCLWLWLWSWSWGRLLWFVGGEFKLELWLWLWLLEWVKVEMVLC